MDNTIEIEFGSSGRNRRRMIEKGYKIISKFLTLLESEGEAKGKKEIYKVYGKLLIGEVDNLRLKDFCETESDGEKFYPLLAGQYLDLGISCYKMKKVDF